MRPVRLWTFCTFVTDSSCFTCGIVQSGDAPASGVSTSGFRLISSKRFLARDRLPERGTGRPGAVSSCRANCLDAVTSSSPFPTVTPFIAGPLDPWPLTTAGSEKRPPTIAVTTRCRSRRRLLRSSCRPQAAEVQAPSPPHRVGRTFRRGLIAWPSSPRQTGTRTTWDFHRSVLSALVSR